MRRKRMVSGSDNDSVVDMTPMLDVVFILLIFFIVTASFVKEAGVDVLRPGAETGTLQKNVTLFVAITAVGDVWINHRKIDKRAVRANVERLHAENPQGSVVVQADKRTETGTLIEVMDQIRLAGVTNVAVATEAQD
ncbi:MAG: biopolymer transporter ExbD [Gammaproteobacteria bacterium]|nr:biopolymer transporter ExbD [Gammaproteobacteria bacterium]